MAAAEKFHLLAAISKPSKERKSSAHVRKQNAADSTKSGPWNRKPRPERTLGEMAST